MYFSNEAAACITISDVFNQPQGYQYEIQNSGIAAAKTLASRNGGLVQVRSE
jgi:hypothetical protein